MSQVLKASTLISRESCLLMPMSISLPSRVKLPACACKQNHLWCTPWPMEQHAKPCVGKGFSGTNNALVGALTATGGKPHFAELPDVKVLLILLAYSIAAARPDVRRATACSPQSGSGSFGALGWGSVRGSSLQRHAHRICTKARQTSNNARCNWPSNRCRREACA